MQLKIRRSGIPVATSWKLVATEESTNETHTEVTCESDNPVGPVTPGCLN